MPEKVTWQDLLEVYLHAEWQEGDHARVNVANDQILALIRLAETSEAAQADANLAALATVDDIQIGQTIEARVGAPRLSLGVLAKTWNDFLQSPGARIREPATFFIKEDRSHEGMIPEPRVMTQYRAMLRFVGLLEKASLFLDVQRQTLIYFKDKKIEVPVFFLVGDLRLVDADAISALSDLLQGEMHTEQRLAIFADAVVTLVASQPEDNRLVYLAQNVAEINRRVSDGYRLFASSFSYSKIRGEVEAAQSEYVSRIHKTFVDIQGQLLGLPIASIVVATQLKSAESWGAETWGNIAVITGAWLFAVLLCGSCVNQWFTLSAIQADVDRQKQKLTANFAEISGQFSDVFVSLSARVRWHRVVLCVIVVIAISGAIFATIAFCHLTKVDTQSASKGAAQGAVQSEAVTESKIETEIRNNPISEIEVGTEANDEANVESR